MTSLPNEIVQDMVQTLRTAGSFGEVCSEDNSSSQVPRTVVLLDSYELLAPDDSAGGLWGRLRATVSVRTRGVSASQAADRAADLCNMAMDALAVDPYRGGLCSDLPVGRATELGRAQPIRGLRRPEAGMTFDVRCHFETETT